MTDLTMAQAIEQKLTELTDDYLVVHQIGYITDENGNKINAIKIADDAGSYFFELNQLFDFLQTFSYSENLDSYEQYEELWRKAPCTLGDNVEFYS